MELIAAAMAVAVHVAADVAVSVKLPKAARERVAGKGPADGSDEDKAKWEASQRQ